MATAVIPDEQVTREKDKVSIRRGTPLFRVNKIVSEQPQDQDESDFLVGDIRDVCAIVKDKPSEDLRTAVKGKKIHEQVSLSIAQVKQLVAAALKTAR